MADTASADIGDPPVAFRRPRAEDARAIWRVVAASPVLETNSAYAYLLFCTHFADTCLVAESGGQIIGFVIAYRPPVRPDAVFVWQIGVDESARGRGVGSGLLSRLVEQPACTDVAYLEATVTPSNEPSRRLFLGFARKRGATPHISDGYPSALFPDDAHEPEQLFRIGPLRS